MKELIEKLVLELPVPDREQAELRARLLRAVKDGAEAVQRELEAASRALQTEFEAAMKKIEEATR